MKILSVEITNITSIEGPYLLNFEEDVFANIGLFGITGPVGAGKSSIIDAICLGLYNTTPRLEKISSSINIQYEAESLSTSSPQNLLRRGAASGQVCVRFTGIDGNIWRSNWMLRRSRNQATGKLQSVSMTLFNESLNEEFPDTRITNILQKIKELISLDFKQFTKSVILAQGDFQAFLHAADTDRAQILEKLTGTEIYSEISRGIFENYSQIKAQFEHFDQQIAGLQLLSPEDLELIKNQDHLLQEQNKTFKTTLDNFKVVEDWYAKKQELENQVLNAKNALQHIESELDAQKNNSELISRIEQVQDIKPIWLDVINLTQSSENLSLQIKNLEKDKNTIELNVDQLKKQVEATEENQKRHELKQQENEPLYKSARVLDNEIESITSANLKDEKEIKDRKNAIESIVNEIEVDQKSLLEIQKSLTQIETWFSENAQVKNWVENERFLQDQFSQFHEINTALEKLKNTYYTEDKLLKVVKTDWEQIKVLYGDLSDKNDQLKLQLDQISNQDNTSNLEELIKQHEQLITLQQNVKELVGKVDLLHKITKQKSLVSDTLAETEKTKTVFEKEEITLKSQLETLQSKVDEQQIFVKKLEIESSENVLSLRQHLQEGCACPVCGSEKHPYKTETVIDNLLAKATSELKAMTLNFDETKANYFEVQGNIKAKEVEIQQLKIQENQHILDLKTLDSEISELNTNIEFQEVENLEKLKSYATQIQKKTEGLQHTIQQVSKAKQEIEKLNKDIQSLQKQLQEVEAKKFELEKAYQTHQHTIDEITKNGEKFRKDQISIKEKLSSIITLENWFKTYSEDPKSFVKQLFSKVSSWNSYTNYLNELIQNRDKLQATIEKSQALIDQQKKELLKATEKFEAQNIELNQKIAERKQYFGGLSVDDVLKNMKVEAEDLKHKWQLQNNQLQNQNNLLTKTITSLTEKTNQLSEITKKINEKNNEIETFIIQFNSKNQNHLTATELKDIFSASSEFIQLIKAKLNDLSQQKSKLQGSLQTVSDQLETHLVTQTPELTFEDIQTQKQEILKQYQETEEQIIAIKSQILAHEQNIKSQENLLKKREELIPDYNEWKELNDLLGSATGDKLKKIAQQFTLDLLLQSANAQLSQINNRYRLERITDTLSILVIDQYMGNTKRGTSSLSGGETFLVSLALSLALSSVASTQLKVESLFIDEGFGNLDPNALETAFLALENLQNQGRMVGIISHLDTVIDRLAVKVQVIPQGNGKSKIEVIA